VFKGKYRKIMLGVIAALLLFIMGFATGGYWGWKQAQKTYTSLIGLFTPAMMAQYSLVHYFSSDNKAAEGALLEHLQLMENLHDRGDKFLSDRMYYLDTMLILARLSKVEKRLGDNTAAQRYMAESIGRCKQGVYENCSEAKIFEIVDRLDNGSIFNPGTKGKDNKHRE
jgi:hypothetical protein